jgi:hypothetical protein
MRRNIGAVALALGVQGTSTLAIAAVDEIEIRTAPPPDRVEIVPAPRPGFIYEKGHYAWDGRQYVWTEGRFIKEREGHKYTPYAFEKRGEVWYYRPGFWDDNQK